MKLRLLYILLFLFGFILLNNSLAFAQNPTAGGTSQENPTAGGDVIKTLEGQELQLRDPLSGKEFTSSTNVVNEFAAQVKKIIDYVLGLVGVFALVGFIWGGVEWIISEGNQQRIEKGRKMMIWSIIGILSIFSSYAILSFVFNALIRGSGGSSVLPDGTVEYYPEGTQFYVDDEAPREDTILGEPQF